MMIGERARSANQEQLFEDELDDDDRTKYVNDIEGDQFSHHNIEKSDESGDIMNVNFIRFPEPSLKKQKSIDRSGTSGKMKKFKRKHGSSPLKEDIHSLVKTLKSTNNTSISHAESDPTIEKCIDVLENIPGILGGSDIFNYVMNMLTQKEMRQAFFRLSSNEARRSWLEHNHQYFVQNIPFKPI
ncbi:hypothetical protein HAX54_045398 [Datura stramonium]|uniref:Uncharacterized protein n=1 Tax=Datura stramonium TaxID=4076 RepID=A0ABS8WJN5_DATST|nr:hypothetical protein [Datura stramonium]